MRKEDDSADAPFMMIWNRSLETGHATIDDDHRNLVDQLNKLSGALARGEGKERILGMILFLNHYAREHFAREEVHMQRVGCPAAAENCRAHAQFVAKLDTWVGQLQSSDVSTPLVLEVHREMCTWIKNHIVGVDCKLRGCRAA